MRAQVPGDSFRVRRRIAEEPNRKIASPAQNASHGAGIVVVVDVHVRAMETRQWALARCALVSLCRPQRADLLCVDPVLVSPKTTGSARFTLAARPSSGSSAGFAWVTRRRLLLLPFGAARLTRPARAGHPLRAAALRARLRTSHLSSTARVMLAQAAGSASAVPFARRAAAPVARLPFRYPLGRTNALVFVPARPALSARQPINQPALRARLAGRKALLGSLVAPRLVARLADAGGVQIHAAAL